MMNSVRFKPVYVMGVIFLLTLIPLFAAAMDQKADEPDNVLNAFEKTHAKILAQVRQKVLPPKVGAKADELNISLQKYLIQSEARLKILKLDVLYKKGEEQKKALDEMLALSAERERIKMNYLQRLKALAEGISTGDTPAPPSEMVYKSETNTAKAAEKKEDIKWSTKTLDIEIESAPEDISKGDRE